jgi:hypothetical protein
MPNDQCLSTELISEYDDVRKFFIHNPDERCIPLFLNSFGDGSGFGVYQLVEDVIKQFDKTIVLPYLLDAIKSDYNSIRYWCIEIAGIFPDNSLIPDLKKNLYDSSVDIRTASMIALSQIKCDETIEILREALKQESDNDVLDMMKEIFEDMEQ